MVVLEAKTHLLFLASIVRNEIFQNLKAQLDKDRKNFTVLSAIREMDKITVTKNINGEYVRRYTLTKKQKKILSQFSITKKNLNELVAHNNNENKDIEWKFYNKNLKYS